MLGRMQRGDHVTPSAQTLGGYLLDEWLPVRQERIEANTWEVEAVQVRAYILPRLGSRPLQDLTVAELEHFYAELRSSGRRRGPGGLAPKTVKNVHGISFVRHSGTPCVSASSPETRPTTPSRPE